MSELTLEYRRRFWTVVHEDKPIATFPSLHAGMRAVPEALIKFDASCCESPEAGNILKDIVEAWNARHTLNAQTYAAILNPRERDEPDWALPMSRAELISYITVLKEHMWSFNMAVPLCPTADSDKPKG